MTSERGRPQKLTPDIQVDLVKKIQTGATFETAAASVGISVSTLRDWRRRGEREIQRLDQNKKAKMKKSEEIYVYFSAAIKKAEADAELRYITIIATAAKEHWQSAAWMLERRYPETWGRKDRQEVTHHGSVEITGAKDKFIGRINQLAARNRDSDNLP